MTEYEYSPHSYDKFRRQKERVGQWAASTAAIEGDGATRSLLGPFPRAEHHRRSPRALRRTASQFQSGPSAQAHPIGGVRFSTASLRPSWTEAEESDYGTSITTHDTVSQVSSAPCSEQWSNIANAATSTVDLRLSHHRVYPTTGDSSSREVKQYFPSAPMADSPLIPVGVQPNTNPTESLGSDPSPDSISDSYVSLPIYGISGDDNPHTSEHRNTDEERNPPSSFTRRQSPSPQIRYTPTSRPRQRAQLYIASSHPSIRIMSPSNNNSDIVVGPSQSGSSRHPNTPIPHHFGPLTEELYRVYYSPAHYIVSHQNGRHGQDRAMPMDLVQVQAQETSRTRRLPQKKQRKWSALHKIRNIMGKPQVS